MITAQKMRKIATEYHDIIDDDFLSNIDCLIKTSAERGYFNLEVDVMSINNSTLNKLMKELREHGFKIELDVLQSCATISW